MALDRTNMVSLLDIGSLFGGKTPKIAEMGDGYTELSEDWGPSVDNTQYINMKTKSSTVSGYEFSMNPEREYLSDEMQETIDKMLKKFPTGKDCETNYYRFLKTDAVAESDGKYAAIKVPVVISPSNIGGAGGETLTSSIQINGNGDVTEGFITVEAGGSFEWSET